MTGVGLCMGASVGLFMRVFRWWLHHLRSNIPTVFAVTRRQIQARLFSGATLVAIILTFGSISGGHFNPRRYTLRCNRTRYSLARCSGLQAVQFAGAIVGAIIVLRAALVLSVITLAMWGAVVLSEFVATFGILSVIWGCSRLRSGAGRSFVGGGFASRP